MLGLYVPKMVSYQLGPRFNEDDLMKTMKRFGYYGTLAKSALVSSKIYALIYDLL